MKEAMNTPKEQHGTNDRYLKVLENDILWRCLIDNLTGYASVLTDLGAYNAAKTLYTAQELLIKMKSERKTE